MGKEVNRNDLISRLDGFIRRLELQDWSGIPDSSAFLNLHKEIITQLRKTPKVYKVCNIDMTSEKHSGFIEYDTLYFCSLSAAQRELRQRFFQLVHSPLMASPDEIVERGLTTGVLPHNCKSVIVNGDLKTAVPHERFKFYEVRMLTSDSITPIQLLLTQIRTIPSELPCGKVKHQARLLQFPGCPEC